MQNFVMVQIPVGNQLELAYQISSFSVREEVCLRRATCFFHRWQCRRRREGMVVMELFNGRLYPPPPPPTNVFRLGYKIHT